MTWKESVSHLVREFCDNEGRRTFSRPEIWAYCAPTLAGLFPENNHREAKLRQTLQFLRDDGLLTFEDNRGHYTLRGVELLRDEITVPEQTVLAITDANAREYARETVARDRGWVRTAKRIYGTMCLVPDCANTFLTANGEQYVEVHHIDFLCNGGEEEIWNLSVVCAHHHRMAHFADSRERHILRDTLIRETQTRLVRPNTSRHA